MGFIEDVGLTRREDELAVHLVFGLLNRYREVDSGAPSLPELMEKTDRLGDLPMVERHAATIIGSLENAGLINGAGRTLAGGPSNTLSLTTSGRTELARISHLQSDVAARRRACRTALLLWLYDDDSKNDEPSMPVLSNFFSSYLSYFWGQQFTIKDLDDAGRWLRENKFIDGVGSWGGETLRARITTKGIDCVEHDGGNITAYIERTTMTGGQQINFGGDFVGQFAATGRGDITQTQDQQVDIKKIMDVLEGVRSMIPNLGLEPSDAAGLQEAIDEIEATGNDGTLNEEGKESLLKRIVGFLANATSTLGPTFVAAVNALNTTPPA